MLTTLIGLACILGASRLLLAGMGFIQRRFQPPPEVVRKLMHAGMGTVLLACPFFFDRPWPVMLLAAIFIALLIARFYLPFLHGHVAHVIYGVERHSLGEFYFPITTALLFLLARGSRIEFCIPMMLLSYADANAALIGRRYGRCAFHTIGGRKSVEGCVAFFVTAIGFCAVPLLVHKGVHPGMALLISLNIALVTTFLEAASWRGSDNITVPLAAWALLHWLPGLTGPQFVIGVGTAGIIFLLATATPSLFARFERPSFLQLKPAQSAAVRQFARTPV